MATDHYLVTIDPTDLVAANSLAIGTTYSCQYNGPSVLRVSESVAVPDDMTPNAYQFTSRQSFVVIPKSGEGVYLWVLDGGGIVVINEVQ